MLNRQFITSALKSKDFEVYVTKDGEEGLAVINDKNPEVILLDIMMPDEDGYSICGKIKSNPKTGHIPVIFLTAMDSIKDKLKGFDIGAADFITKPFNHKELIARVKTQVSLSRAMSEKEKMLHIAMEERRNAVVARIAGGISHNFSNLVGVSLGNLLLIESLLGNIVNPVAKEALSDLKKSLERQKTLIKQFIRLSNRGFTEGSISEMTGINLNSLVDEIFENLLMQERNSRMQPVSLQKNLSPNLFFLCDPGHAREITHMIFNEVISAATSPVSFTVSGTQKDKNVVCVIAIKGFCVAKEIQESIFEPFALPLANVGTGLGFSVVKSLVEFNKGKIVATSSPDENTMNLELTFLSAGNANQQDNG
ncbi:MAG: hybrid sensor histidine kinase/response regulator [Lentisphaerae bacterium]|nr:hybrid sensor histidine kinase/response regulator [Lentisphaerota bacterium]